MRNLIKNLKDREAQQRQKLMDRYRELLQLGDGASEKHLEEISGLAQSLGKNAKQVEADILIFLSYGSLSKIAAELPSRESNFKMARAKLAEFRAEMEAKIAELQRRDDEILSAFHRAEMEFGMANRSAANLKALAQEHWELLGIEQPLPDSPPQLARPINWKSGTSYAELEAADLSRRNAALKVDRERTE